MTFTCPTRAHSARIAAGVALIAWVLIGDIEGGAGAARIGAGAACLTIAIAIFSPRLIQPLVRLIGAPVAHFGGLTGKLARENSLRTPARTAITSAALMIGIALIVFVTIFASGLNSSVTDVIEQNVKGEIVLQGPGGFVEIPPEAVRESSRVPGVEAASGVRYTQARVKGSGGTAFASVDPRSIDRVLEIDLVEGTQADLRSLAPGRAVVGEDLANRPTSRQFNDLSQRLRKLPLKMQY
jgi:putative ABC transport system permease protein